MQVLPTILSALSLSLSLLTFQFVICVYVMFSTDCSQVILTLFNWTMISRLLFCKRKFAFFTTKCSMSGNKIVECLIRSNFFSIWFFLLLSVWFSRWWSMLFTVSYISTMGSSFMHVTLLVVWGKHMKVTCSLSVASMTCNLPIVWLKHNEASCSFAEFRYPTYLYIRQLHEILCKIVPIIWFKIFFSASICDAQL